MLNLEECPLEALGRTATREHQQFTRVPQAFTRLPHPGYTLPIAEWLVQDLSNAPQLCYISTGFAKASREQSTMTKDSNLYTRLRIKSYTNGIDTLVHARQDIRCIEGAAVEGFSQ